MQTRNFLISISLCVLLAACSQSEAPNTETPKAGAVTSTAAPAAVAVTDGGIGEAAFKKTCAMCHQTGVAGAPKLGDKADWAPRIAQGKDMLYKHAIEGFNGEKGAMPAKGGNPAMGDDDVKAAVDFMIAKSE